MSNWLKLLQEVGIDIAVFIAGLSGGLVSLRKDEDLTIWQKVLTVLSGGLISTYITPLFIPMFERMFGSNGSNVGFGLAFVIGYMGLKSIEFIITSFTNNIKKNQDGNRDN